MARIEKTFFISYRRTDESWGLAIFQDLTQHGYDVFIDYDGIASGNFETVILENIRARAHFLVLLTPTALERCRDPKDWMRREIEAALDSQRNIVPVMLAGFDFGTSATASQLTGKLAALKEYNGLEIPKGYFAPAMERLRNKFLNLPVDAVLHSASVSAQQVAKEQKDKATIALGDEQRKGEGRNRQEPGPPKIPEQPPPKTAQRPGLSRRKILIMGALAVAAVLGVALAIADFRLHPKDDAPNSYYNLGLASFERKDYAQAIADFTEVIRLDPKYRDAYFLRGNAYYERGFAANQDDLSKQDYDQAIADFTEMIRRTKAADFFITVYYMARGHAYYARGNTDLFKQDYDQAIADFTEVIRRNQKASFAWYWRGLAKRNKGDLTGSEADIAAARAIDPNVDK
jgi:tetratricopeptide (TPR) repeat protein